MRKTQVRLKKINKTRQQSTRLSFQGAYAGFIYTYGVTEPISLPHKTAGYLASIFWAAITAGRLLSIPLSYRFQPVKLLVFNLVRAARAATVPHSGGGGSGRVLHAPPCAFPQAGAIVTVLMLLIFYTSKVFLFAGTCLCGLFLSSIFPLMLAYIEDIFDYQGIAAAPRPLPDGEG